LTLFNLTDSRFLENNPKNSAFFAKLLTLRRYLLPVCHYSLVFWFTSPQDTFVHTISDANQESIQQFFNTNAQSAFLQLSGLTEIPA